MSSVGHGWPCWSRRLQGPGRESRKALGTASKLRAHPAPLVGTKGGIPVATENSTRRTARRAIVYRGARYPTGSLRVPSADACPRVGEPVRARARWAGPAGIPGGAPPPPPASRHNYPAGDTNVPNRWAGTGWRQLTAEPAATMVRRIAEEAS